MKETQFYHREAKNKVKCSLCPHNCSITIGKSGVCKVRENREGRLYSLVYGKIVASNVDPIEKKPFFHLFPGSRSYSVATVGCNLSCRNCQNWQISQVEDPERIAGETTTPQQIVESALRTKCSSIAYTYTEPTIFYEFAYDCAELAHQQGLKNIFVTNGYMNEQPLRKIQPFLDACNVDLKSIKEEHYRKICGGHVEPVKKSIQLMKKLGIWVEVTTLIIPTVNDSKEELKKIVSFIKGVGEEIPWHISAFYPHYKMQDIPPTPVSTLRQAREIGLQEGLKYVYTGNAPGEEGENTYCYNCGSLVIQRCGFTINKNSLKENKCPHCGRIIDGIF